MVIALVSFAETYSVGKAISSETKQKVDVDQELLGQGLANLIGSFLQCYPVAGSFSRTAINIDKLKVQERFSARSSEIRGSGIGVWQSL